MGDTGGVDVVEDARRLAAQALSGPLPRRWAHVQAVAAAADRLTAGLPLDRDMVLCAAWLHDIGYAPTAADTGFHPLDGARYLRAHGWAAPVAGLVAHHSFADVQADCRGLGRALRTEFPDTPGPERDVLWAADATTGPDGQPLTVAERVADVVDRYGRRHEVAICMRLIRPDLEAAHARVRQAQTAAYPT